MNILFVCTGNSCRSPMAEAIARKIFKEKDIECNFLSGGVSVLMALPPSDNAIKVMEEYGIDLSEYRTRQITGSDIDNADIVLTMTKRHKDYLELQYPEHSKKTFPLNVYAGTGNSDIADPFGESIKIYKSCAKELEKAVLALAEKISQREIAIASDHGGFELKELVIKYLEENKISYKDFGVDKLEPCDYPVYAEKVAKAVLGGKYKKGILLCGTGIGISIAANKYKGIRAALCHDVFSAKASREHNDANILVMGGRVIGAGHAELIVQTFLDTAFSNGERHIKRIGQIELG